MKEKTEKTNNHVPEEPPLRDEQLESVCGGAKFFEEEDGGRYEAICGPYSDDPPMDSEKPPEFLLEHLYPQESTVSELFDWN